MKKFISLLLAITCILGVSSCKKESEQPKGELTLTAVNTKNGFSPDSAMDGDVNVGWVGSKKATESNFQVFDIDFGEKKTFTTITLDDSFNDGYTNRRPDYVPKTVTYQNGNASSVGDGTLAGVLSGSADGQSWKSDAIPTSENAQWIWLSLAEDALVKKLELNNEMNNSVPVSYEVYYSQTAHNRRNEDEYTDVSTYSLLDKQTENTENIIEIELDEEITVRDLFIKIFVQQNEGVDVVASIDEILFYGETPSDYYEEHQPEKFTIMGSNDGKTFEVIKEVSGNYQAVWTYASETSLTYRYIRYIVFAEYNNNYPSIGEITFS
ncbi:MAG: hypothetical protein IJW64_00210 [Clostridia bacterium]|nr:hypothetical protein [Clostridia bacterium]